MIREDRKNPGLLFLGTDKAVYVSIDAGTTWTRFKNNMPTQPVHDLIIHPRDADLVVGTHGRGFFITDISPLQELTSRVLEQDVFLFSIEPKVRWVIPSQKVVSSINLAGPNEPSGVVINYYLRDKVDGEVKITVAQGERILSEMTGPNRPGLNSVEWSMSARRRRPRPEPTEQQNGEGGGQSEGDFYAEEEEIDHDYERVSYNRASAAPGEYTVTLTAADRELTRPAVILEDLWYDQ